jgi:acyl-CoA synthetase (AMP-forming)/AMP-acid ligase II
MTPVNASIAASPYRLDHAQYRYESIADVLKARADSCDMAKGYVFFLNGVEQSLSWSELYRLAKARASKIARLTKVQDRILLACPAGPDYVVNLFACWLSGRVATPCYPPQGRRHEAMFRAVLTDCRPTMLIVADDFLDKAAFSEVLDGYQGALLGARVDHAETLSATTDSYTAPLSDALALLQYTSGSTGRPKGVRQTHANLLHNLEWQKQLYHSSCSSRAVIWLPPYHDMGLGSGILQPLYSDAIVLLLEAKAVARDPYIWLAAVSNFDADVSGAPTFAYALAIRSLRRDPAKYAGLNLENWTTAFVGAEPIDIGVLRDFCEVFGQFGFSESAFVPSYGLAESTLLVCGRRGLLTEHIGGTQRTSCGNTPKDGALIIVDPDTKSMVADGEEGEIYVDSASVADGYWAQDENDANHFDSPVQGSCRAYLATGDLGVVYNNELFITGRLKNTMIIAGRKIHLEDIERNVAALIEKNYGGIANAIAIPMENMATPIVAIAIEVSSDMLMQSECLDGVAVEVKRTAGLLFELTVAHVAFNRNGTLPRTSSGKFARAQCRQLFEEALQMKDSL